MKFPRKIFVVSHESTLTGAPILLLDLLKILNERFEIKFTIIVIRDGELTKEFSKLGRVYVIKGRDYGKSRNIIIRFLELIKSRIILISALLSVFNYPLIFYNTITNGHINKYLKFLKKPTIIYVHELSSITKFYDFDKYIKPMLSDRYFYIYPSNEVKKYLHDNLKIEYKRLFILNYYVPDLLQPNLEKIDAKSNRTEDIRKLKVCGIGVASPRKGTDLFINVASIINKFNKEISFCWIGGCASVELESEYRTLLIKNNLNDVVEFTGKLQPIDAKNKLSESDILFLSSREDPYPLVVLEAAMLGIPSIVFKESGGISDFVTSECGWVVNDFNLNVVSELINGLACDEILLKGKNARNFYLSKHGNSELVISQFVDIVKKI